MHGTVKGWIRGVRDGAKVSQYAYVKIYLLNMRFESNSKGFENGHKCFGICEHIVKTYFHSSILYM